MRRLVGWSASCVFLGLIAAPVASAQPGEPFRDTVDVDLVEVDVFVADRRGRPVRELEPEDFELFVDGRPVEISNFAEYRVVGEPSEWVTTGDERRAMRSGYREGLPSDGREALTVVLYMDDLNTHPAHRARLLRRLEETVEPLRRVNARFMLAAFGERVEILVPPTADLGALLRAAANRPKRHEGAARPQAARMKAIRDMIRSDEACAAIPDCDPCEDNWGELMTIARSFARDDEARVGTAVDGLADLVTTLAGVAGRKAVVYVSSGLPQQSGVSVFTYLVEQVCPAINSTIMRNSGDASMAGTSFNQAGRFNLLSAHANANRVTVLPLDAAGLRGAVGAISMAGDRLALGGRAEPSPRNDNLFATNAQDGLFLLAEETGGKALVNSNDFTELLGDAARDVSSGYSLGFLLTDRRPAQVRQVEVRLAGGAGKGRRVRYRRSFRDKTLEERLAERLLSVAWLGGGENPLDAGLQLLPAGSPEKGVHGLSVAVAVPEGSVTLVPGPDGTPPAGGLRLWMLAVNEAGGTRTTVRQRGVRVGVGGVPATAGAYRFEVDLVLPEGDYDVAVGVRDETTGVTSLLRETVALPLDSEQ